MTSTLRMAIAASCRMRGSGRLKREGRRIFAREESAFPFDFETGLLNGIGVKYKTNRDERYRFDGHPDTGVSFEGFFLPCYDQVKKLSSTRARTFPLWIILDSTSSSRKTAESSSARSTAFPK